MEQIDIIKRSLHRNWELTRHIEKVLGYHKLFGNGVRLNMPEDQCEQDPTPAPDTTPNGCNCELQPKRVIPSLVEAVEEVRKYRDAIETSDCEFGADFKAGALASVNSVLAYYLEPAVAAQKRTNEAVGELVKALRRCTALSNSLKPTRGEYKTLNAVAAGSGRHVVVMPDTARRILAALDEIEKGGTK